MSSYTHGTGATPLLGDTIGQNLDHAIAAYPDRDALVDVEAGARWTYAEFGAAVDQLACGLLGTGVAKGDRVGIWAVNCAEWVLVQYATARIGAIMVNITPAYRGHELAYVLNQAGICRLHRAGPDLPARSLLPLLRVVENRGNLLPWHRRGGARPYAQPSTSACPRTGPATSSA